MKRIQSDDTVVVIAGKSKGHVGKIMKVLTCDNTVLVEGGNLSKKHMKSNPRTNQPGGIVSQERPIHVSNVAMYNPVSKKADKVGFKFIEKDGKMHKVRYFKSNGEVIDLP